ncbi:hypothetical protein V5799_008198 [Amblyomma americanum]|uniref:Uncharacterized protein n=1 Tax=Amblyomma americanum TaxID=6943 RepID=A0AAQ4FDZ0_AMBAM
MHVIMPDMSGFLNFQQKANARPSVSSSDGSVSDCANYLQHSSQSDLQARAARRSVGAFWARPCVEPRQPVVERAHCRGPSRRQPRPGSTTWVST